MATPRQKLFLCVNILSIIQVSLLETVHFTNSPRKILKANNYTTYKVEVPNGDPITIIEANTPLINKKIKFNQVDNAAKYSIHHDRNKQVVDLETSLSMTVTPNNYHDEYENSAAASEEESVTNVYSNLSPERHRNRNTMKTVYSPELLQKFLKDYANKIHTSSSSSSSSNEAAIPNYTDNDRRFEQLEHASGSIELNPNSNEGSKGDKYASIETDDDTGTAEDGNRRVSSASEDDKNDSEDLNDIQQRKNYRPNGNYNGNHPYNQNNGWVTLDAVPWSKSKVSKWQSHNANKYGSQGNYNYPNYQNSNNNNQQRPPYRPTNDYDFDYNGNNNNNDDYYLPPKPSRPTYHNNQFYGGGQQNQNQPSHRPPQDNFYQSSSGHHQTSSVYNFERPENPQRPYQPEIITDNRPSNFPPHHSQEEPYPNQNQNSYSNRPSYNRPQQNDYSHHGGNYYAYKENKHPPTYPVNGYQFPKRNGQRAMSFLATNGVNSDSKYTDNKGIITAESQKVETFVRPHRRTGPTKMSQQQVKLTVLPLYVNEPGTNYQNNENDVKMDVFRPSAYNGLIETDQGSQTVEESVANESNANAVSAKPVNKPKKKRKVLKNYLMRKNAGSSDSSAVIAAVGASLLPASLGLIAPMVLGK
ncbi:hypothetical protein ACKWTF_010666 [Chironomus riparius]